MNLKFMRGMNLQEQKKCGILLIAIGLVMFVVGFLLGDAYMAIFITVLAAASSPAARCGCCACTA